MIGGAGLAVVAVIALSMSHGVGRREVASESGDEAVGLQQNPNKLHDEHPVAQARELNGGALPTVLNPWPILVSSKQVDMWEKFVRLTDHGAKVAFKTAHGRYLTAQVDGAITGDGLTVQHWQTFHEL